MGGGGALYSGAVRIRLEVRNVDHRVDLEVSRQLQLVRNVRDDLYDRVRAVVPRQELPLCRECSWEA